jgi:hypothetical protein
VANRCNSPLTWVEECKEIQQPQWDSLSQRLNAVEAKDLLAVAIQNEKIPPIKRANTYFAISKK